MPNGFNRYQNLPNLFSECPSEMNIEKRRYIRFSLDLQAYRRRENYDLLPTLVSQVSIGGCMIAWDENIFIGEKFRIELELPNKNRLPLLCRALYKFPGTGVGAKFVDITEFEQRLLGEIISHSLEDDGLPLLVDPFTIPPTYLSQASDNEEIFSRQREDNIAEEIMSPDC